MRISRYIERPVRVALDKKMVLVGGPRQVGKTTFALGLLGEDADEKHPAYMNWDHPSVPPRLRKAELPPGQPWLLLDEIHKYARWRNLLKGIYDTEKSQDQVRRSRLKKWKGQPSPRGIQPCFFAEPRRDLAARRRR